MRTMLLPSALILLCSLAQFATSKTVEKPKATIKPTLCGDAYKCYVPDWCTDGGDLAASEMVPIKANKNMDSDCPALFRFHAYSTKFVHVTIVSFDKAVKSVELVQTKDDGSKATFSCAEIAGAKIVAKYGSDTQEVIEKDEKIENAKLRCTFIVKTKKNKDVFLSHQVINQIKIGSKQTRQTPGLSLDGYVRCNPHFLKFNKKDATSSSKNYKKVAFKPGEYFCEDAEIYKMEYRKSGASEYEAAKLTCPLLDPDDEGKALKGNTFYINDKEADDPTMIDVRCAADTRFFCDYEVKAKAGETPLALTRPNIKTGKQSGLACDKVGKKHLIVGDTPFLDPVFECKYHGDGQLLWTVKNAEKSIRLDKNGVEAYCTDKLDCAKVFKIPDSAVTKGQVDGHNLAACYEKGVLHVDSVDGKVVTGQRCNAETGRFMYSTEGEPERQVLSSTQFVCVYPDIRDTEAEAKMEQTISTTKFVSIGVGIFFGAVIIICGIVYSNYRIRQRKRAANEKLAKDEAAWNRYCLDDDERNELKSKQETDNQPVDSSVKDKSIEHLSVWNNLQLHSFSVGLRDMFPSGANKCPEVAVPLDKKVQREVSDETVQKLNQATETLGKREKSETMMKLEEKYGSKARQKCGME